jgi:hypothetical protein
MRASFFVSLLLLTACSKKFDGSDDGPNAAGNGNGNGNGNANDGDDDSPDDLYTDDDGDGYTEEEGDCDDSDANVGPNQAEECNGVDDDCDGEIDESGGSELFYADADGDTYGDPGSVTEACDQPAGYVTNNEDCDDDHDTAYPGGTEISWNDIDEDCDGLDYTLDACIEDAINDTSEAMTSGYWAIDEYEGTYTETITGFGLPVANWIIDNQYLYLTEISTSAKVSDDGSYAVEFEVDVGMNDSSYSGSIFEADGDTYYEGPFWIDMQMDSIYSYLGLNYATYCNAWVDPVEQAFSGSLNVTVDLDDQTVSGDAQLSATLTALAASDVNTSSMSGEAECQITYIDMVIDQLGYGDTLGILDETFETTLTSLVATYEDALESNIAESCSAE